MHMSVRPVRLPVGRDERGEQRLRCGRRVEPDGAGDRHLAARGISELASEPLVGDHAVGVGVGDPHGRRRGRRRARERPPPRLGVPPRLSASDPRSPRASSAYRHRTSASDGVVAATVGGHHDRDGEVDPAAAASIDDRQAASVPASLRAGTATTTAVSAGSIPGPSPVVVDRRGRPGAARSGCGESPPNAAAAMHRARRSLRRRVSRVRLASTEGSPGLIDWKVVAGGRGPRDSCSPMAAVGAGGGIPTHQRPVNHRPVSYAGLWVGHDWALDRHDCLLLKRAEPLSRGSSPGTGREWSPRGFWARGVPECGTIRA